MGKEVHGTVTVGGQKVAVKADFASDHVLFSGGRRGEVPYTKVQVVGTAKGILRLRVDDAAMEFPVGDTVDRLANKIRKPPSLLEKLGVHEGDTVATVSIPKVLGRELESAKRVDRAAHQVFLGVASLEDLEALPEAATRMADGGGLWVVYPKGRRDIRESDVRAAGRAAGLIDTKVARISTKYTALRFSLAKADA